MIAQEIIRIKSEMGGRHAGVRRARLSMGVVLCAALFVFIGCPDGNDPGDGGTTDDTTLPVIALTGEATVTAEVGGDFTDEGATVTDNDPDYGDNIMATATITNSDGNTILTIDTSTVGATYTITYNAPADAAGNEAVAVTRTVTVVDTMNPVIALTGGNLALEVGDTFNEPGVTVMDNDPAYGDMMAILTITSSDGTEVLADALTDAVGTYTITYRAPMDASGNEAEPVTRMVSVVLDGMAAPVITLTGAATITVELGLGTFMDPGATVRDNDLTYMETATPTITGAGTTIDINIAGTYTITYNAPTDGDGNDPVAVTRTVTVVDTTAPVITLTGDATVTLELGGTAFADEGAMVDDNDDDYTGTVSATITDSADATITAINIEIAGTYTVTYTATPNDAAGLTPVVATRTVIVVDTTRPIVTLNGVATVTLDINDTFVDEGAMVDDNDDDYTGTVSATIRNSANAIVSADMLTDAVGIYTITYTADNDAAGNTPVAVMRTVRVRDTEAPVVTRTGDAIITLVVGDTFNDPGAMVADNDPAYMGMVITIIRGSSSTAIDTNIAGTYIIDYRAPADASGNLAIGASRTVRVQVPVIMTLDSNNNNFIDINTIDDLNTIRNSLAGNQVQCGTDGTALCMGYELLRDLDFANPAHYDSGTINPDWRPNNIDPNLATNPGWDPIGRFSELAAFSARFNGNGNTISNLYVRQSEYVGLFGVSIGTLDGIGIVDARLYGEGGNDAIGGLVGNIGAISGTASLPGTIINSYVTGGSINGEGGGDDIGGLVGYSQLSSTVTGSYATGVSINGGAENDTIGGLVGRMVNGGVTASYATGVSIDGGAENDTIGGLIGTNSFGSTVTASYATGNADGGAGSQNTVGGLIGSSQGAVTASYATGNADGGAGFANDVGGLIGRNQGAVTASYATGDADGGGGSRTNVGGLIGNNSATVTASYATGAVSGGGGGRVGGFIGTNFGTFTASYGFGTVTNVFATTPRSTDASPPAVVANACALTQENSSATGTDWDAAQWDFGTTAQRPVVLHNGTLVPGQTPRTCI